MFLAHWLHCIYLWSVSDRSTQSFCHSMRACYSTYIPNKIEFQRWTFLWSQLLSPCLFSASFFLQFHCVDRFFLLSFFFSLSLSHPHHCTIVLIIFFLLAVSFVSAVVVFILFNSVNWNEFRAKWKEKNTFICEVGKSTS